MPRMDGTGPMGLGSQTGRGMDLCRNTAGNAVYGCGRGFRRSCSGFMSANADDLMQYEKQLEERLSEVRSQIEKSR